MKSLLVRMFSLAVLVGLLAAATTAADPSGKWTWTTKGKQRETEFNLTLKAEGEKVTGTLARGKNQREAEISNGAYKDGTVSFEVTTERRGNKVTAKYSGKVDGDTIKGTVTAPRGDSGQAREREWEAKRAS